jgi:hypothetical protein
MLTEQGMRLRDVVNACRGFRILGDHEHVKEGDQTAHASSPLDRGYGENGWLTITSLCLNDWIGVRVADLNDPKQNMDLDAEERLFRRRLDPTEAREILRASCRWQPAFPPPEVSP